MPTGTLGELLIRLGFDPDSSSFSQARGAINDFVKDSKQSVNQGATQSANMALSTVRSFANTARRMLGVLGIGLGLRSMNALVESFNNANDALTNVIDSSEDLHDVQESIRKSANESRISYEQLAGMVSRTATLEKFNTEEAIKYSENLTKLLTAYGHGDSVSSVQSMLNRVMQSGHVGSYFSRQMAGTPEVLELIAKKLGTTREKIDEMAKSGKITAETIKEAFLESTDDINEKFKKTDILFTDALRVVRNNWGFFLNDLNDATGIGNTLGHFIVDISEKVFQRIKDVIPVIQDMVDKLGGAKNVLKDIAVVLGIISAIKIVDKIQKAGGLMNVLIRFLMGGNAQFAIMAAAVAAVGLAIEDLIVFVKGGDSIIGRILEKNGVDVDKARENVVRAFGKIKEIGLQIIDLAKRIFQTVWPVLKPILEIIAEIAGLIAVALIPVIKIVVEVLSAIVEFLKPIFEWIGKILEKISEFVGSSFVTVLGDVADAVDAIGSGFKFAKEKFDEFVGKITSSEGFKSFISKTESLLGKIAEFLGWTPKTSSKDVDKPGGKVENNTLFTDTGTGNAQVVKPSYVSKNADDWGLVANALATTVKGSASSSTKNGVSAVNKNSNTTNNNKAEVNNTITINVKEDKTAKATVEAINRNTNTLTGLAARAFRGTV